MNKTEFEIYKTIILFFMIKIHTPLSFLVHQIAFLPSFLAARHITRNTVFIYKLLYISQEIILPELEEQRAKIKDSGSTKLTFINSRILMSSVQIYQEFD